MNMSRNRSKNRRAGGFTLIELLVVIAIIAVLMGILMPALGRVREQAKATVCRSNLKNVGLAVQMYLDDFSRKIPNTQSANRHLWKRPNGDWREPGTTDTYWGAYYRPYIQDNTKIFGCPSLQRVADRLIYQYAEFPDPSKVIQHAAFGLNHHQRARGRNTNDVYKASEFIICMDHAEPRPDGGVSDSLHNNDVPGAMNLTQYRRGGSRSYSYRQIFRHNVRSQDDFKTGGENNILWLDGHVTRQDETTGDDFRLRYYTGDRINN
jgi:prepilin-type N-terminal cleavage/methylation domain-containing protein/prepilin-type processing-associated H-X9-DG protein